MQADLPESSDGDEVDVAELARLLSVEGMPIQRVIGEECGVSQSTVSRALHGLIGQSPGAKKLWRYAQERMTVLGGDRSDAEGPAAAVLATPTMDKARIRAKRQPRLADARGLETLPVSQSRREDLERQAIEGLRDYLDDRFDPMLVIEQLAVLRRAQDSGRRARTARSQGESDYPR